MTRCLFVLAMCLSGCVSIHSVGRLAPGATANDAFLVEITDTMPGDDFGFVSASVITPGRSSGLPHRLTEEQLAEMRASAGSFGAEVLVIERVDGPRREAIYAFGLRRMTPPGGGLVGVKPCSHPSYEAALASARDRLTTCLDRLRTKRKALQGTVRVLTLVDGFGGVYRAAITPDSTRDGMMGACGLDAASDTDFGRHDDVLCRAEFQVSL